MTQRFQVDMPSQVSGEVGFFDRFAETSSRFASRAPFFAFCVLLIVVWAPTFLVLKPDTWQLVINTVTTVITFLMVALLQNGQTRNDQAMQHKLNAIADGLAVLMSHVKPGDADMRYDIAELKKAVGLEHHESTTYEDDRVPSADGDH